jgi:predicted phage terminase large subunit-like protein
LSCWRGRLEFPALKRQMVSLASEYSPAVILVEDKANGQSLIQELKYETALPIRPVKVDGDKMVRAQAVTPMIEAGKVFLPESAPWIADFLDELAAFPSGVHDDTVDSVSQALNYLRHQERNTVEIYELQGLTLIPLNRAGSFLA